MSLPRPFTVADVALYRARPCLVPQSDQSVAALTAAPLLESNR